MKAATSGFLEVIGGPQQDGTIRILRSVEDDQRALAIFEFGLEETLCIVSAVLVGPGEFFGSLRLRVGQIAQGSILTLNRLSDFLAGKFVRFEPRGGIDQEEVSEVWVEFDSVMSYRDQFPIVSIPELVDQLVVFFQEAQDAKSAIEEWQQELDDYLLPCESSTGGTDPLRDPNHWLDYVEERDKDELGSLMDREVEKFTFESYPGLKFHSLSEASSYLGANYPDSLELECTYEGQTYFFQAAIHRASEKVYGPSFGISIKIE